MIVAGIGILFSRGAGIGSLETALKQGWQPPVAVENKDASAPKRYAYQVSFDSVPDKSLLKKIRRADKLSKMAVVAAADALADSGAAEFRGKTAIILATAFGAHVTTFGFLDDILDYGDAAVSPTTFSNSVHNAAASYIASSLDIKGPTLTITQFRSSFPRALQLAKAWLEQGRCDHVLAGGVDQYGDVLGYVSDQKLMTAADGKIRPFVFNPAGQVPGEGAAFFVLTRDRGRNDYCSITEIETGKSAGNAVPDLEIIDADGMMKDESIYTSLVSPGVPVAAYSPVFGSMMVGGAFNLAAAALMIKKQTLYAAPVQDNPKNIRLVESTVHGNVGSVRCIGSDCKGEVTSISLSRL